MKMPILKSSIIAAALLSQLPITTAIAGDKESMIERGRYLVTIGGCNDCHTEGYAPMNGKIAESEWLLGSKMAFSGPWGATYPTNLRLSVQQLSESEWLPYARAERLPPMPWFNLAVMTDKDLIAIYRYLKHLGAKGEPAPTYLPPDKAVNTPYIDFAPKNLPQQAGLK